MKNKGLTFETLYKKLNLTNAIYQLNTKDAPINSGKLLIKGDQTFEPESVYIGMVSDLPKTLPTDDVINLICVRDFEDLFIDKLENKVRDKEIILERLKYLEWKDSDKYHVFTVDIAKIDKTNSIIYYLKSSIQALSNSPHVVVHDKHIVIIIGSKKENQFRIENFESIVYFIKQNKLFAGLSKSFTNISDLHKYYKQSIKSIEFGLMLGNGEDNLFIYEDYSIFHLIQICSKQSDIMDFCHPSLLQLIDYDKNNDTDYYKSLEAFIMHDLNLSDAAETIFIHRNTMSYRITKIKNLTGINLNENRRWHASVLVTRLNLYAQQSAF